MNKSHRLSKSRFLLGSQCQLRLWNDLHSAFEAEEASESQLAVFRTGQEVGALACERYPGGHLIAHDYLHFDDALADTNQLLNDPTVPAIFEAAFEYEGLIARADVIERLPNGGWRLIEVKSTINLKNAHILDFSFQLFVLRSSGLDVREGGVLTLNRDYVYDGGALDLDALFTLHDAVDQAEQIAATVEELAHELQSVIVRDKAPEIEPGDHCFEPYPCPFYAHCTRDVEFPEHGIEEIPRLSVKRRDDLLERDIVEIRNIPSDFPLSARQQIVRSAVVEDRAIVNQQKLATIDEIERPIYHLDFETFSPAIPRFAGTSPYNAIPFLFSVHIEREESEPEHKEYLHEGSDDPRPQLAERLIQALGSKGAIFTYGPYERTVISGLINAYPEYSVELQAISDRIFNLHRLVEQGYYHPEFRGSVSLKNVLPVLCPDLGYEDLEIADGRTAAVQYVTALESDITQQQRDLFDHLRDYCKRDTLATLKIRQVLSKISQSETAA